MHFSRDGAIERIVLTRPDASNAIDLPAGHAMNAAVTAAADDAVKVVLLSGEGRRFCAGGDVASMGRWRSWSEPARTRDRVGDCAATDV
ncbi:MAG: enoyl-CoA hydratase/isomerase family protein [Jatrophihabitantaceae bacterium]